MAFTQAVQSALIQNYANFRGRALRSEFWYFMLAFTLVFVVAAIIDEGALGGYSVLETLVTLAAVVPTFAVGARRLHDTNRSGWWQLLQALPLIGIIVLIVWFASRGDVAENRFGPPPT